MKNSASSFLFGFFLGGLLGVSFTILYAPMEGKKLRKKIARTTDDILDDVNDYLGSGRKKAEDLIKSGRKKAESIVDEARKIVT